jgi:hypothetical protein
MESYSASETEMCVQVEDVEVIPLLWKIRAGWEAATLSCLHLPRLLA